MRPRRSAQSSGQVFNDYVQPRKLRLKQNIEMGHSQRGAYDDEMRMYNEMDIFAGNHRKQKSSTRNTFK